MGVITEKDITICGHGSGRPSTKNLYTYTATRYAQKASNGKHKGIVAVRRLKGLTDKDRAKFHDTYKTILGRNYYSQSLRAYVYKPYSNGKYYSDCSSSGIATLAKMGFKFPYYLDLRVQRPRVRRHSRERVEGTRRQRKLLLQPDQRRRREP